MHRINRRELLRRLGVPLLGATVAAVACRSRVSPSSPEVVPEARSATATVAPAAATPASTVAPTSPTPAVGDAYLAVARGPDPAANVEAALRAIGGIERFVAPGNDVIVKPNICVAYRAPEYAATTNPDVVAALVRLCRAAGAKRVRVMDQPFGGTADEAYKRSGIADAVDAAGGEMEIMAGMKFESTSIPEGQDIKQWSVYRDALDADVLINVPIAKTHELALLTLGMKNLMGLIEDRGSLHSNLAQRIADLTSLFRPQLTVIDATRILIAGGPTGGDLNDVRETQTVVASHDVVAADAFASTLFGLTGSDVPATLAGASRGLGTLDLNSIKIEEIGTA